jgi:transcriptional regulator GlxA family with amidase domain
VKDGKRRCFSRIFDDQRRDGHAQEVRLINFAIVVLPDAYLSSIGAMVDSYALAFDRVRHILASESDGPEMTLSRLSLTGQDVTVGDGMRYVVDRPIAPDDRFDFVWLPAFRVGDVDKLKNRLAGSQNLIGWIREQASKGAVIGASGAAALLLLDAKLLEGRTVPIARALTPTARLLFPRCTIDDKLGMVDYGDLLVANGIANDFAVIARGVGRMASSDTSRWLTAVTGLDRTDQEKLADDPLVASAQLWLEQRFASEVSISRMAEELFTTHQTLIRHFKKALGVTPQVYVQHLRLAAAQRMLATSNRSIDRIAGLIGYSDVRLFRSMFRRYTGMTATAWRQANRKLRGRQNIS